MLQLTIEENEIYLRAKRYICEHYAPKENPYDDESLIFDDNFIDWSKPSEQPRRINRFCETVLRYFDEDLERLKFCCKIAYPCTHAFDKICEKIFSPTKAAIYKLLLAAEFDLEAANGFLQEVKQPFCPDEKFDVVMNFFFENRIYNFTTINKILYLLELPPLGGGIM